MLIATTILIGLPIQALAEFTVTFHNENGFPVAVYPRSHECLHHPNYFEKTVPARGSVQAHAKWYTDKGCEGIVKICRGDTSVKGHCVTVYEGNGDAENSKPAGPKQLYLTTDGKLIGK